MFKKIRIKINCQNFQKNLRYLINLEKILNF